MYQAQKKSVYLLFNNKLKYIKMTSIYRIVLGLLVLITNLLYYFFEAFAIISIIVNVTIAYLMYSLNKSVKKLNDRFVISKQLDYLEWVKNKFK